MHHLNTLLASALLAVSITIGFCKAEPDSCNNSCSISCSNSCSTSDCTPHIKIDCRNDSNFTPGPSCGLYCNTGCYGCGTTTYIPRSQADNSVRELVGWNRSIFLYNPAENYASIALAVEYTQTFDGCDIAKKIFCTDCLTFTGSQVIGRNNGTEVLADNFGLSPYFKGTLKIKPKISNYIIDVQGFWGLPEWLPGLFLQVNVPICHTRWDLGLTDCLVCDNLTTTTTAIQNENEFPECAMGPAVAPAHQTLRDALSGDLLLNGNPIGDLRTPWKHGRFSFCPLSKTRIADVDVMLGFSIVDSPWAHIALFAKASMPWGNRPKAHYIFEPIVGDGKLWQLGGGIFGRINIWGDPCCSLEGLGITFEGYITHMFTTHQKRSFDFINQGFLSRYMLLKEFNRDGVTYANNIINAIDFATRNCIVTVPINGDFSVMLTYQNEAWHYNLGYNIWGKSAEKVCIKTDCPCDLDKRKFGFKGTAGTCALGFLTDNGLLGLQTGSLPLNATQSTATAFAAGTVDNAVLVTNPDEPTDVYLTAYSNTAIDTPLSDPSLIYAQNSVNPALISCTDLDPNSAAQCSFLTHKVFGNIGYLWFDSCWQPHVSIGGEVEFNGKKCKSSPLKQFGIWFKGGLSF